MQDDRFICDQNDLLPEFDEDADIHNEDGEILNNMSDNPINDTWWLPFLYKEDQHGKIRIWKIGFKNNELIKRHGLIDGEIQTDYREIELNSRSINLKQQALQEARYAYQLKFRAGYRPNINNLSTKTQPQLACNIIDKKTGKWRINEDHLRNGITCQAKLDGFRGIIWSNELEFISRDNVKKKWLEHIKKELEIFFTYLPTDIGLDGELYNHQLTFSEIQSAINTTNYEHYNNKKIKFYIFDVIILDLVLNDRITLLNNAYKKYREDGHINNNFYILPMYVVYTYADLTNYFNWFIQNGYEGVIVRKLVGNNPTTKERKESLYRSERNNSMFKMKLFHETEGLIVGIKEAKGRDKGSATLIVEWKGKRFGCRPAESYEVRKKWFENPELVLYKVYTFIYQELSDDGIPRFPTGKCIRENDYKTWYGIIEQVNYDGISSFILNSGGVRFKCIPSGDSSTHIWIKNNAENLINKKYMYRYMELEKNGAPENPIGVNFC